MNTYSVVEKYKSYHSLQHNMQDAHLNIFLVASDGEN